MRAMKAFVLFGLLFSQLTFAAQYSGNFLICASEDNNLKMTADLSDGKGEKVAVAVADGKKLIFEESVRGRARYQFSFYPNKKTPLIVAPVGKKTADITVSVNPENSSYRLVLDRKEPLVYRVAKFNAFLNIKKLNVSDRPVSCTESKWEND